MNLVLLISHVIRELSGLTSLIALVISAAAFYVSGKRDEKSFRLAWYKEVVAWARDCVRQLSAAHEICAGHNRDEKYIAGRRREVLEKLTSLIDEGRFLFENDRSSSHGKDKPYAYQGIRPDLMDYLVSSYNLLSNFDPIVGDVRGEMCSMLIDEKRKFVSDIQRVIQPNWFSRQAVVTPGKNA